MIKYTPITLLRISAYLDFLLLHVLISELRLLHYVQPFYLVFSSFLYFGFFIGYFVICVSAGVMYWGDAYTDNIETAFIDGTGRRLIQTERGADYFSFVLYDDDIYFTDWNSP